MDTIPSNVCSHCKRVPLAEGPEIVHKHWCTPEYRSTQPPQTRSATMPNLPRTPPPNLPVTSSADTGTTPTATVSTAASDMRPTPPPQPDPAAAPTPQQRIEILEQALRSQQGLLDIEQAKTEEAVKERDDAVSDLYVIEQERDQLKQQVSTPRPHPPVPGSVQAVVDAGDRRVDLLLQQQRQQMQQQQQQHEQLIKSLIATKPAPPKPTPAPVSSTPKVNPAARNLETPLLEDPANVNLHHFESWRHLFELNVEANHLADEPFPARKAYISHAMHAHWQPLVKSNDIQWLPTQSMSEMLNAVAAYIKLRRHPLLDRRDFLARQQRSTETHETFLQQLRELLSCSRYSDELTFPLSKTDFERTLLRDLFLRGISNNNLRIDILKHPLSELSLDKVMELARNYETANVTSDNLSTKRIQVTRKFQSTYKKNQKTNAIQRRTAAGNTANPPAKPTSGSPRPGAQTTRRPSGNVYHRACDSTHAYGAPCSASTHTCSRCNTRGHVETSPRCPKSPVGGAKTGNKPRKNVRALRLDNSDRTPKDNLVQVRVTHQNKATHKANWDFIPDSGADVTAASLRDVTRLVGKHNLHLTPPPSDLSAVGGLAIDVRGILPMTLTYKDRTISVQCYVMGNDEVPILGKPHLIQLGLLPEGWPRTNTIAQVSARRDTKQSIASTSESAPSLWNEQELYSEFPKVFMADGKFRQMKGPPLHISLVEGAIPFKLYKPYTVPLHYETQLREKLDKMIADRIIERVPLDENPEWTAGLVVVDKKMSSDIRITTDFSKLNRYVKRPGFAITVPSDKIRAIPNGMRYFTSFDAKAGYWQVKLDPRCKHLTTFITTTHNLLRYLVLPQGLSLSASAFGTRVEQALRGLTNVTSVVEDVLVFSPTLEQHKEHVRLVLKRCHEHGIQLNRTKTHLAKQEIDYCGYRLTSKGYTPSPHLTNAISDYPRPSSKTDIRSFVGLINVLRDFDESIAELASPLTSLMSPKVDFLWTQAQEQAFQSLKSRLLSPKILVHFIPDQPLRMETDASRKGLGFCLFQMGRDHIYRLLQVGSRHITPTESRYSVTEIELLAVVWALNKAKFFCQGAPDIDLIIDHRPLVSIINFKTLGDLTTPRIQRLRERLNRFPNAVAIWREGKKQVAADALSRSPVDKPESADLLAEHDVDESVRTLCVRNVRVVSSDAADSGDEEDVTKSVATDDLLFQRLRTAARSDSTYRKLHELTSTEFPDHKSQLTDDLKPFWSCRDFLSTHGTLVLYKHRIVVPQELQKFVLEKLHASHNGVTKTMLRAQESVFWPNISHHIRDMVQRCTKCQRFRATNAPETPLHNVDFENPTAAGQYLSLDFFTLDRQEWLVISCNFSGYFIIYRMGRSAVASDLIRSTRDWASHFGWPIRIRSDGGPQMDSAAYRDFCKEHCIRPNFSSPLMHCATAEVAVKCAKSILRKTSYNSAEYYAALLEYRSSPRSQTKLSPNSLIYKKPPRTLVPVISDFDDQPAAFATAQADARRHEIQSLADTYARHKDDRPILPVGQSVLVQNPVTKLWDRPGTIIKRHDRRRSYLVQLDNSSHLWRNRKLLQPVPSTKSDDITGDDPASDDPPISADTSTTQMSAPRRSKRVRHPPNRF